MENKPQRFCHACKTKPVPRPRAQYCDECRTLCSRCHERPRIVESSYCTVCTRVYKVKLRERRIAKGLPGEHRNKERLLLRSKYAYLIKTGRFEKKPCAICDTTDDIQIFFPLGLESAITFLCRRHHVEARTAENREKQGREKMKRELAREAKVKAREERDAASLVRTCHNPNCNTPVLYKHRYCVACRPLCHICFTNPAIAGRGNATRCRECATGVQRATRARRLAKLGEEAVTALIDKEKKRNRVLRRIKKNTRKTPCVDCGDKKTIVFLPDDLDENKAVYVCRTHWTERSKGRPSKIKVRPLYSHCTHCGTAMHEGNTARYCLDCTNLCHDCWERPRFAQKSGKCKECFREARHKFAQERNARLATIPLTERPRACVRCGKRKVYEGRKRTCNDCLTLCSICQARPTISDAVRYCTECIALVEEEAKRENVHE